MNLQQRIDAFVTLGRFLAQFVSPIEDHTTTEQAKVYSKDSSGVDTAIFYEKMIQALQDAHHQNTWFTYDNLAFSCKSWSEALTQENLTNWISNYTISKVDTSKTIAIVMAGNIPFICTALRS
jgi:hypothetical protein